MKIWARIGIILMVCASASMVLFISLSGYINQSGTARTTPKDNILRIDERYLYKESETNDSVNVSCILYLTNLWNVSGEVKMIAYVMNKEGMADYRAEVGVGRIDRNKTVEVKIPLVIKEDNNRIEILIFEDDLLVLKGYINIYVHRMGRYDASGEYKGCVYTINVESSDFQQNIHVLDQYIQIEGSKK